MKLLPVVLVLLCYNTFAQKAIESEAGVVTTTDEYNYLAKGLRRVLEEGADAKAGYTLQESVTLQHDSKQYTFTFRPFIKIGTNEVVAVSLIMTSKVWGNNTYYFCIPRNNTELASQYVTELRKLDGNIRIALAEISTQIVAEAFGQIPQN